MDIRIWTIIFSFAMLMDPVSGVIDGCGSDCKCSPDKTQMFCRYRGLINPPTFATSVIPVIEALHLADNYITRVHGSYFNLFPNLRVVNLSNQDGIACVQCVGHVTNRLVKFIGE